MIKNKIIKISILCIIFFLLILIIILFCFYYLYVYKSEKDFCLDTGACKNGTVINTEYGVVEINEQTCIQYGWKWNKDTEYCYMK